jgi:phage terminase large subunit-like protein
MRPEELPSEIIAVANLDPAVRRAVVYGLESRFVLGAEEEWATWAHEGQETPKGDWRVWLMMAGRGFGKTKAGAEWVSAMARADGSLRIALVGATLEDVRKVMVEGESGLIKTAQLREDVIWVPSRGTLTFASGAMAFAYSGEDPEKLRGPEHHFAWCDELAKWRYAEAAWNNLMLGLRLGEKPRTLVTTTPQPLPLLKRLIAEESTHLSGGRTRDNRNLPDAFVEAAVAAYGGTRIGRQELEGELIEDAEGSLWKRALIEASRVGPRDEEYRRVVIGVDPPASSGGDACGIVAVGLGGDGVAYVIGDHSMAGLSPEGWARRVAEAYALHQADRVIAENNNGGDMVESVLRGAALNLPVKRAFATRGKVARAEPVAALFEKGRAKFAGAFPELEDELAGLTTGGGYQGPGRSPDRADAMVWAMTELMLGKEAQAPRIRAF